MLGTGKHSSDSSQLNACRRVRAASASQLTPVAAGPQREHRNQMDAETRGVVVDAISGFIAGAACTLVFQPLDTILVRQQYVGTTTMESAVAVLKRGGNLALWRGATPLIALVPFQNALLMVGYGAGQRWGERHTTPQSAVFVGGCAGGLAQSFVASPF